jgi:hypothetical protein
MAIATGLATAALIGTAVKAGTDIVGGVMQKKASDKAADATERAADKALAFEEKVYADEQGRLQPYRDAGTAAMSRMDARRNAGGFSFGSAAPQAAPMATAATTGFGGAATARRTHPAGGGMSFGSALVPLTAPDGTTAMIPPAKVPYYKQKWAQMGGAA